MFIPPFLKQDRKGIILIYPKYKCVYSNNYTHVGSVDRTTGDVTIDISGTTSGASVNHTHTYTNNNQQNVSITPKYVQVYAWKRTA